MSAVRVSDLCQAMGMLICVGVPMSTAVNKLVFSTSAVGHVAEDLTLATKFF